jgi:hypothetical protein
MREHDHRHPLFPRSGGAFVLHHTTATAATSVTLAATPDTAYFCRVRAVKWGTRSAPSMLTVPQF